ncbi:SCA7, zinc-binding domain-containing protein [Coprinopsis sp. MPI-PUGE-AT-0042]|nr:SCA7, zinc-binding domain-containing protein [Coprinopsis sp. MPI-PUGE-AT-0042]
MVLPKLKPPSNPPSPFKWDLPSPTISPKEIVSLPQPPTAWLSARDMKLFGSEPLTYLSEIGVSKCKDCGKPVLRSCVAEHRDLCATIRAGKHKGSKGKLDAEGSKKRKGSAEPDDLPQKKKHKPATKVTKGRMKGPVDLDRQCGVINDKGLPCSRSLTCKSHSMGAKRSVEGRSRKYDELLLDWQRAHNPNFVEPVKRETKAEKKEKREREKQEKKRLEAEAAAALGLDATAVKKTSSAANAAKKASKKAAVAAARLVETLGEGPSEDLDDLDSETELDDLTRAVKVAHDRGVVGVPLAVPCDAGSWFVQRRERARVCRDLFIAALGNGGTGLQTGISALGLPTRTMSNMSNGHPMPIRPS